MIREDELELELELERESIERIKQTGEKEREGWKSMKREQIDRTLNPYRRWVDGSKTGQTQGCTDRQTDRQKEIERDRKRERESEEDEGERASTRGRGFSQATACPFPCFLSFNFYYFLFPKIYKSKFLIFNFLFHITNFFK